MPRNHRFRFFLAPDTDGAPAGGGSAPAVLDGPIQPSRGGGEVFDPTTYTPPSDADISDFVLTDGKEAPEGIFEEKQTQTPPKEEKPTEEKKEEPPKEEVKKPEQKKEPPAAQLRNELKKYQEKTSELEKRSAELEKQLEEAKTNKEAQELRQKLEANEKRIADIEKEKGDYERKLLAHNPHASKRLNDLRETFNREWQETVDMVPQLKDSYSALLNEFAAIPRGSEGADAMRDFQDRLREEYGFNAERVYNALFKGVKFRSDYARAADEVQRDAEKYIFEEQLKEWETNFKRVDTEWSQWFTPPADAETTDPFNAMLFLQKFTKEVLPAEENARLDRTIQDYVKQVVAGAQPRTKDDFPGMSDEQIAQQMKAIEERVGTARQKLPEVLAKSMKLAAMTGPLIKEISRLRSRLKEQEEAQPPDPTKKDGVSHKRTGGNETSLEDLDIPNAYAIEQSVMRGA